MLFHEQLSLNAPRLPRREEGFQTQRLLVGSAVHREMQQLGPVALHIRQPLVVGPARTARPPEHTENAFDDQLLYVAPGGTLSRPEQRLLRAPSGLAASQNSGFERPGGSCAAITAISSTQVAPVRPEQKF